MQRPDFTKDMTFSEFIKFYWYKTELQIICHENNLPSVGTKGELNNYIKRFLDGKESSKILTSKNNKRTGVLLDNLTPKTKLLESGFCFNTRRLYQLTI
ncbi:SAP domain-containing protein [Leuconostoc citreum]